MKFLCYDTALNGTYTLLLLQKEYPIHRCLFQGTKDENIWDAAPWLFAIDSFDFSKIEQDPVSSLKEYTIFETSDKIEDLCEHLHQFIYKIVDGREVYYRFWDARVLQRTLPEYSESKLKTFFEFIDAVYVLATGKTSYQKISVGPKGKLSIVVTKASSFVEPEPKETEEESIEQQPKKRRFFLD